MDWKLELIVVPVADVGRAKAFYMEQVGFDLHVDHSAGEDFRVVQLVPPGSACAIAVMKAARPRGQRARAAPRRHRHRRRAQRAARAGRRGQRAVPLRRARTAARTRSGTPRLQLVLQLRGPRRERMARAGGQARRRLTRNSGRDRLADLPAQAQERQRPDHRGDHSEIARYTTTAAITTEPGCAPNSSSIPTRPPSTARKPPGTGTEFASIPTR